MQIQPQLPRGYADDPLLVHIDYSYLSYPAAQDQASFSQASTSMMRMPPNYVMMPPQAAGYPNSSDDENDDHLGGVNNTIPVGMTAESRDLYRKDCDDHWREWAPEEIGVNANSTSAKKFALIIRRQKHRDDTGELAFALYSITVQSPLIKKQLGSVFDGYKGINTNLRKLDFKAPFHEFFYRWEEFVQAMPDENEENEVSRSHYKLLFDTISKEMTPHIEQVTDLVKNNVISFQYVWALFEPGIEVYTKVDGHDRILILLHGEYQKTDCGIIYNLSCRYVDTDGERFGYRGMDIVIQPFGNLRPILELDVVPCRLQPGIEVIREQLIERGQRFVALKGVHHRSYTGVYERANPPAGHPKKQNVSISNLSFR